MASLNAAKRTFFAYTPRAKNKGTMMKTKYLLAVLCAVPLLAHAELYKQVDADGHVTYSSAPLKGGKKIYLEPLPTMVPLAKTRSNSPNSFPRVDDDVQKGRDDTRRKILQDELATEQKLLAEAKQNQAKAEDQPQGNFVANGKSIHNEAVAQEYAANVSKQSEQVSLHQKNIDALNAELAKLK
jgi:hypothetical protein